MRAAKIFVADAQEAGVIKEIKQLRVDLYGSLALTGAGHRTPDAVLLGLEGETPEHVETSTMTQRIQDMFKNRKLNVNGQQVIDFDPAKHLKYHMDKVLPQHPNGLRISAFDAKGDLIYCKDFYSIGGGFVVQGASKTSNIFHKDSRVDHTDAVDGKSASVAKDFTPSADDKDQQALVKADPSVGISSDMLPFYNAESLSAMCKSGSMSIAQVVFRNELQWRPAPEIAARTLNLWSVMNQSIHEGITSTEEFLPGPLKVKRRAPTLHRKLLSYMTDFAGGFHSTPSTFARLPEKKSTLVESYFVRPSRKNLPAIDWLSLYAIAVNEQNGAGGRVVTAPTNGSAGTIPAVLKYYLEFICPSKAQMDHDIIEFLLTSAAIGMLFKRGASLSAAEMGCQGEIGVACSMAAGAFAAVNGGSVEQILNAAEIGIEHSLGLTCDPVNQQVLIPCIERNAIAAVKAVTAAQLAMNGDGKHRVSLDQAIETMRQTGIDMMSKYKETSLGGLAVNVPVC